MVPISRVRTFAGFEMSFDPFCSVGRLSHIDRVRQAPEVNTNTPASTGGRACALFCIHTSEHFYSLGQAAELDINSLMKEHKIEAKRGLKGCDVQVARRSVPVL